MRAEPCRLSSFKAQPSLPSFRESVRLCKVFFDFQFKLPGFLNIPSTAVIDAFRQERRKRPIHEDSLVLLIRFAIWVTHDVAACVFSQCIV